MINTFERLGIEMPQAIFKRQEIPVAEYLMGFQQALRDDFMEGFESLEEAIKAQGTPTLDRRNRGIPLRETERHILTKSESGRFVPNVNSWQTGGIRYRHPDGGIDFTLESDSPSAKKWKTAYKILEEFGDDCPIANYSCMAPNSVLQRHTGIENRTGEFIRFHIPLIVPEGDIFLEVNGEEVRWDDCFAFNNQLPHSAHNYSNEYRLIFLIDFRRSRIGMPPAPAYDKRIELLARPFVRNKKDTQ